MVEVPKPRQPSPVPNHHLLLVQFYWQQNCLDRFSRRHMKDSIRNNEHKCAKAKQKGMYRGILTNVNIATYQQDMKHHYVVVSLTQSAS